MAGQFWTALGQCGVLKAIRDLQKDSNLSYLKIYHWVIIQVPKLSFSDYKKERILKRSYRIWDSVYEECKKMHSEGRDY